MKSITVYCGSSNNADECYYEAARRLGTAIATKGHRLVYGGGGVGLMGALADRVHEYGGVVHGVITEQFVELEQARHTCDELEIVTSMSERKNRMMHLADAFVALPGGLGTYEELFETIVARVIADHGCPIVVVNTNRYFDGFLEMIRRGADEGFIKPAALGLITPVDEPEEALAVIEAELAVVRSHDLDSFIPSR